MEPGVSKLILVVVLEQHENKFHGVKNIVLVTTSERSTKLFTTNRKGHVKPSRELETFESGPKKKGYCTFIQEGQPRTIIETTKGRTITNLNKVWFVPCSLVWVHDGQGRRTAVHRFIL